MYIIKWTFKRDMPKLEDHSQQIIRIQESDTRQMVDIANLLPKQSIKSLGCMFSPTLKSNVQEKLVQQKVMSLSMTLARATTINIAWVHYNTVYLSAMRYKLSQATISHNKLAEFEKSYINQLLPKLGYTRNFPRAVVHALVELGALGFNHYPQYKVKRNVSIKSSMFDFNKP
ncbi:hypothetical protein TI04_08285 [Achromatium sp. WMS2]|nr:hypothetical protein TI04_08285 [Achromatium sp. WMS2]